MKSVLFQLAVAIVIAGVVIFGSQLKDDSSMTIDGPNQIIIQIPGMS